MWRQYSLVLQYGATPPRGGAFYLTLCTGCGIFYIVIDQSLAERYIMTQPFGEPLKRDRRNVWVALAGAAALIVVPGVSLWLLLFYRV